MRKFRSFALVVAVVSVAACGGGNGSSTDDAEFCEYLGAIEDIDPQAAPDDALAAIDDVIGRAPNGDVKKALQDLRPIFERMTTIDSNDEAAFSEMMSIMFDPKVIAAGEVLEKYGTEVCGFEAEDVTTDTAGDGTADPDMTVEPSALEDLESGDISEAVEAVPADVSPKAYVASSGWSAMGSDFSVDVDISGTDDIDGVPLCQAVVDLLVATDPDARSSVSITLDGKEIATSNMDSCLGLIR